MIQSAISSSHHYYIVFFESTQIKALNDIVQLFKHPSDYEEIYSERRESIIHLQLRLDERYGSESILKLNQVIHKGATSYWYDFYLGSFNNGNKKIYFISYPYARLVLFLNNIFRINSIQRTYYKTEVGVVLEYMQSRSSKDSTLLSEKDLEIDITKYTASIKEDINAKQINLIGDNPLNSKVFDALQKLKKAKKISMEPISLKLKFKKINLGEMELAFDHLGNNRYWLKRNAQTTTIPIIKYAAKFFTSIEAFPINNVVTSHTDFGDEQQQ